VSFRGEEEPEHAERAQASAGYAQTGAERDRGRPSRMSPLLLLFALLLLALLAVAAIILWRSLGESISGTSIARDSIDSAGPDPRVRLANAAGQVRVEGVKGYRSVDYEATRYAMAADPAAAKQRASEVPVDISREDSKFVIETDGGEDTGADYTLRVPTGGSVEVESEVGDVSLEDLILGTLEASVEAGDVTLSGRFSGGGRVTVETGDIIAKLPPDDTRDLTLETRFGSVLREPADGGAETEERQGS
jgi:hypothetical protein